MLQSKPMNATVQLAWILRMDPIPVRYSSQVKMYWNWILLSKIKIASSILRKPFDAPLKEASLWNQSHYQIAKFISWSMLIEN